MNIFGGRTCFLYGYVPLLNSEFKKEICSDSGVPTDAAVPALQPPTTTVTHHSPLTTQSPTRPTTHQPHTEPITHRLVEGGFLAGDEEDSAFGGVEVFGRQFRPRFERLHEHTKILGIPFAVELFAKVFHQTVQLGRALGA